MSEQVSLKDRLRVLAAKMVQGRAGISAQWLTDAADTIERLEAENARLRAALEDAKESVQHWGAYADKYFQDKWDLAGEIKAIDDVLAGGEAPEPATKVLIADIIDPV